MANLVSLCYERGLTNVAAMLKIKLQKLIFIFVHGFNISFSEVAKLAQTSPPCGLRNTALSWGGCK